jgi:tRNA (cytidine32/uridine32-2'-O)-methyltransferase
LIRIVLVEPSHPGNIGACARAMKNMALTELVLVRPKLFPHPDAVARASGADDVLTRAHVVDTLAEAVLGCGFIAATTSRHRDQNFRIIDARQAAARLVAEAACAPVALLFGAERTGLTNEHLEVAHLLIRIPAHESYLSLNLAMAVQIMAYELFCAGGAAQVPDSRAVPLAAAADLALLYEHWAAVLQEVDFRDRTESGTHLMARLRRLLQRAEPDVNEVNILRGFLTAVQKRRRPAGTRG